MMRVQVILITTDPRVLAGSVAYLEREVRPVVESQPGSLGLSLLAGQKPGVAIVESFWATPDHEQVWAAGETEALVRAELARRTGRPVTPEDYQVAVFEREASLRGGKAVRLTRLEVNPIGAADMVEVFGDTACGLAGTPGFCGALLFADPAGRLISETVCGTPRPGRPAEHGGDDPGRGPGRRDCEVRAIEATAWCSARRRNRPCRARPGAVRAALDPV